MSKGKRSEDNVGKRRSRARRRALQALYQWQVAGQDLGDIDAQFAEEMDMSEVDVEFFREFLYGVPKRVDELDGQYRQYLDRGIEQLDPIERAILRMGTLELCDRLDVPVRVMDYHEHSIGTGTDTRAACYVEMRVGNSPTGFGVGIDRDIVTASFRAVLSAVNRHLAGEAAARAAQAEAA